MATTVNNTTANSKITIIFDAGKNKSNPNDGPRLGTGNTESDVIIDNKSYYNIRSHTEVDANVHALQWNATTNTGVIEYIDNRDNESISSFPQWATNVVIRCEAQNIWDEAWKDNATEQKVTWESENTDPEALFSANTSTANAHANTERENYLSAHSITY